MDKHPIPKRYWVCFVGIFLCAALLFVNIIRTDDWTGDKPFSDFTNADWRLFAIFMIEEALIVVVMFLFVLWARKIEEKRNAEILAVWEKERYAGIKPGDYTHVWFDFYHTARALILKNGERYVLYTQEYDKHTETWCNLGSVGFFDSLEAIKTELFDSDFYCEENAVLDKYGNEIYREE